MAKKDLPGFVVYHPNQKDFYICLEAGGKYMRWRSLYPPASDVRFPREVTKIDDMPLKNPPAKQIVDQGTYTINKLDSREDVERKVIENVKNKSFSFILNGKKLKGRFSFKRMAGGTVLQKFKDKYAHEEDVLSEDLVRTINTMVPDYDESKVKLPRPQKSRQRKEAEPEPEPAEEITADKKIGNTEYHFAFYTSEDAPDICIVTNERDEVVVLKQAGDDWELLQPVKGAALKNEKEFTGHAKALFSEQNY